MNTKLNENECIILLKSIGFVKSTFDEFNIDSHNHKDHLYNMYQFAPFEGNFNMVKEWNGNKKYYIVRLSDGDIQIRAWYIN